MRPFPEVQTEPAIYAAEGLKGGTLASFANVEVNPNAIGRVLAYCGLTDQGISRTTVNLSTHSKDRDVTPPSRQSIRTVREWVYCTHDSPAGVTVYMGSLVRALREPPPDPELGLPSNMQETQEQYDNTIAQARDISVNTVEGLSHLAEAILIGPEALESERKAEKVTIHRGKLLPRLVGAAAITLISGAVAVANHKTGYMEPKISVDALAAVASGFSWMFGALWAETAAIKQYWKNEIEKTWQSDRRAHARQESYKQARGAGDMPELITYQLIGDN
jgi:hypothetical protein